MDDRSRRWIMHPLPGPPDLASSCNIEEAENCSERQIN